MNNRLKFFITTLVLCLLFLIASNFLIGLLPKGPLRATFTGHNIGDDGGTTDTGLEGLLYTLCFLVTIVGIVADIALCLGASNWSESDFEKHTIKLKLPKSKYALFIIGICIIVIFYNLFKTSLIKYQLIYNKSTVYHQQYNQKVQEKVGFYDKLWKTYFTKLKIADVNKETFIEVAKIIMSNRKDGENISWKWVQENTKIPFEEFTSFYTDLSLYVETQREGYFDLEKQCQAIAISNNLLIDTFPNNIYNRALVHKDHINFEYGFLSDSTISVFDNKKENLK